MEASVKEGNKCLLIIAETIVISCIIFIICVINARIQITDLHLQTLLR